MSAAELADQLEAALGVVDRATGELAVAEQAVTAARARIRDAKAAVNQALSELGASLDSATARDVARALYWNNFEVQVAGIALLLGCSVSEVSGRVGPLTTRGRCTDCREPLLVTWTSRSASPRPYRCPACEAAFDAAFRPPFSAEQGGDDAT